MEAELRKLDYIAGSGYRDFSGGKLPPKTLATLPPKTGPILPCCQEIISCKCQWISIGTTHDAIRT